MSFEQEQLVVVESEGVSEMGLNTDAYRHPTRARHTRHRASEYIPGLSQAERLQSIYKFLNDAHRWSIKDFIQNMATAQSVRYAHNAKTRIKNLRKAILEQPQVRKIFMDDNELIPSLLVEGTSLAIREEIYTLQHEIPLLGQFNTTRSPKDLNVKEFYTQICDKAPILWQLLQSITARLEEDTMNNQQNGSFALIAALLSHALAPIRSNSFQVYMGLHFHSLGARRRLIDILHSLNISLSYDSILRYQNEIASQAQVC